MTDEKAAEIIAVDVGSSLKFASREPGEICYRILDVHLGFEVPSQAYTNNYGETVDTSAQEAARFKEVIERWLEVLQETRSHLTYEPPIC